MARPLQREGESSDAEPFIPASRRLPELTPKAIILGVLLAVILAAANAYLGLFAGMTVSASIPAAVISMAVLKLFRRSNILENNAVQTAASAGESLVAGVIFTIPAMVIARHWGEFNYWETSIVACLGGVLGVIFTIPLRRALIVEQPLKFPEGVATAEVLKVGDSGGAGVRDLVWGSVIGVLFKVGASGVKLWAETAAWAKSLGSSIAYVGTNLSPALVAVGYIVGLNIAVLVFIGGALNWWVAIPIYVSAEGLGTGAESAVGLAGQVWSSTTRYLGVGAMAVGGLWALVRLRKSLWSGIQSGIEAYRRVRTHGADSVERTERDTPIHFVAIAAAVSIVPLFFLFYYFTSQVGTSILMAFVMIVAGFLFSAVAAYMAGLVGSSNNPISGVTIATVLSSALLLLLVLGDGNRIGPVAAILIGGCVCCAAAIGGDNMQDLKAGHVLGATPYKQQIMQVIGVVAAAFAIAPVLQLLHEAYGIGIAVREGVAPLKAPQASLTESVSRLAGGIESAGLPWNMIFIGMGIAVLVIIVDLILEKRKSQFRAPVLALAVGIYLPFELSVPIFAGGMLAWAASRFRKSKREAGVTDARNGLLFSAGLITGEALAGIGLAIPIAIANDAKVLQLTDAHHPLLGIFGPEEPWAGLAILAVVLFALYRVATRERRRG